ncbi:M20 family metallopeptidase [Brevibacillus halotolerans]|uniref:M20 family metallopeptidase n=1 Tax=Brevibacillus TaxID=55080 RepID=UPI00215BFF33|nr:MULTISPECIES: M20 family metallopeptidase [Brevibacillus]MCR8965928.1 M20 family metallopeptidase [Brevibacillus laterosporus]MCZ0838084.1 M20 family metallopeptidase [Brevibacillus halotolerans]
MALYTYLQEQMPSFMQHLEESVNIDSPSKHKSQSEKMIAWYIKVMHKLTGGRVHRYMNPTYGDQLRWEVGTGRKRILLVGHYDTVWPLQESIKRPFRCQDGKAYGPGVYDMKAGILQAIFAIQALNRFDRLPKDKTIVLLLTGDEEIGSPTSRLILEEEAKKAEVAFILEPPVAPHGALKTWRKGSLQYTIQVSGVSAHAGVDHDKGISAIQEITYHIQHLHSLTNYANGTTVNVGTITGGVGRNVVADYAEAEVDVRVQSQEEAERIHQIMMSLQPVLPGTKLVVKGGINRPPMEKTEKSYALFALAKYICEQEFSCSLTEEGTGGVSDGNFVAACGVPTLDGLGASGDYAHSPREFIWIKDIPKRTTLLARLLEEC